MQSQILSKNNRFNKAKYTKYLLKTEKNIQESKWKIKIKTIQIIKTISKSK